MTEPLSYDRDGALERLIPLLREIGSDDAADDLVKREEKTREEKYNSFNTTSGSVMRTPVALTPIPAKFAAIDFKIAWYQKQWYHLQSVSL